MRAAFFIFAAATVFALAGPASAQDDDRYELERTEGGFVRMDTRTGEMSFCREQSGQIACNPTEDAQAAGDGDLAGLRRRIAELEARIAALEGRPPAASMPTEEEFERTMGFMERFLRRFWGVAKDLERESETGNQPAPDRT